MSGAGAVGGENGPEGPTFPGATAVSGLQVYDWPGPDGLPGGSPHVHLACTEAYVVVGGEGELHTLTASGLERTALRPGVLAWFGPGTVHRAVNLEALRVVVLMQNSGLPEAGDAVLTFPPEILADPAAYREAARAGDDDSARRRRDLAVEGYLGLATAVAGGDGNEAMADFYRRAVALRAELFASWDAVVEAGALAAARRTAEQISALRRGEIGHLLDAGLRVEGAPEPGHRAYGMCGRLDRYPLAVAP